MKNLDAKAAVNKGWEKLETVPAWDFVKSQDKKVVILEALRDQQKVHSATLMDICHVKDTESDPNYRSIQAESCFGEIL